MSIAPTSTSESTGLRQILDQWLKEEVRPNFIKSTLGKVAVTLITDTPPHRFVAKWEERSAAETEHICSCFMLKAFSHLSYPETCLPKDQAEYKRFQKIFEEMCKAQEIEFKASYYPVFQSLKKGMTCSVLSLSQLSTVNWESVFKKIGEASIYDSLVGNTDRFLSRNYVRCVNGGSKDAGFVNCGNVMIEFSGLSGQKLENVHLIDNTPYDLIIDEGQGNVDDKGEGLDGAAEQKIDTVSLDSGGFEAIIGYKEDKVKLVAEFVFGSLSGSLEDMHENSMKTIHSTSRKSEKSRYESLQKRLKSNKAKTITSIVEGMIAGQGYVAKNSVTIRNCFKDVAGEVERVKADTERPKNGKMDKFLTSLGRSMKLYLSENKV